MEFHGRTTGMNFNQYCSFLFKVNEISTTKRTDEEILAKLKNEFRGFPTLKARLTLKLIAKQRSHYNVGWIIQGKKKFLPQTPSFRYDEDGNILNASGNLMSQRSVRNKLLKHKERYNLANTKTAQEEME